MEKSRVYFTDMRTTENSNLQKKLARLIRKAGIGGIDFEKSTSRLKFTLGNQGICLICGLITLKP